MKYRNVDELYAEVHRRENANSAEGHALDPIQTDQVSSYLLDVLKEEGIDVRKLYEK